MREDSNEVPRLHPSTHVHTHAHTHACICTCTYTAWMHTRTPTVRARTCTQTHTHTHTQCACINLQCCVPNAVGLFYLFNYYTFSLLSQAALAVVLNEQLEGQKAAAASQDPFSPFVSEFGMRLNHLLVRDFIFRYGKRGIILNYLHSLPYKIAHIMSRIDQVYPLFIHSFIQ